MDNKNLFLTSATHWLIRLEYAMALGVCSYLFLANIDRVRWLPALALFAWIDLVGYLPGALAYRRSPDGQISRVYHVLYNLTHSLATNAAVALLWTWIVGAEWALLALGIHLFGDRALFGNMLKSFRVPFEPQKVPAFERFERDLAAQRTVGEAAVATSAAARDGRDLEVVS